MNFTKECVVKEYSFKIKSMMTLEQYQEIYQNLMIFQYYRWINHIQEIRNGI